MNTSTKPLFVSHLAVPFRWVDEWLKFWWQKVPEPRVISFIMGVAYFFFLVTGVVTIFIPPQTYDGVASELLMNLVGWSLVVGSIVGVIGGSKDFWQLERVGIVAMAVGVGFYGFIISMLHATLEGSRLTQLGMIALVLLLLALRMAMIWRYDFRPRR